MYISVILFSEKVKEKGEICENTTRPLLFYQMQFIEQSGVGTLTTPLPPPCLRNLRSGWCRSQDIPSPLTANWGKVELKREVFSANKRVLYLSCSYFAPVSTFFVLLKHSTPYLLTNKSERVCFKKHLLPLQEVL